MLFSKQTFLCLATEKNSIVSSERSMTGRSLLSPSRLTCAVTSLKAMQLLCSLARARSYNINKWWKISSRIRMPRTYKEKLKTWASEKHIHISSRSRARIDNTAWNTGNRSTDRSENHAAKGLNLPINSHWATPAEWKFLCQWTEHDFCFVEIRPQTQFAYTHTFTASLFPKSHCGSSLRVHDKITLLFERLEIFFRLGLNKSVSYWTRTWCSACSLEYVRRSCRAEWKL